jgi:integrase
MPGKRRSNGEGTIYQRQDGRWEASYRTTEGRKRSLYAATQEEARRRLTQAISERDRGLPAPHNERQTLAAYLKSWLDLVKPQVRESGWISYERRVRLYLIPRLGRVKLAQLSPQHVRELHAWMLSERKLSPTTVNHTHGVLGHALKDAQRMGLVARNVCDLIDPPRKNKRRATIYTAEQVAQLVNALKGKPIEPIIMLAVSTGARLGELLALKWRQVDLDRATVTIHTGRAEVIGGYADTEPKTDAGNRTVPVPVRVITILREHRKEQIERRLWLGDVWQDNDYVFPNEIGGAQQHSVPEHRFKKLLARAGLPHIRIHDLRHTAGSLMLAQGVPAPEVSRILGHASVDITYRLYAHAVPQAQQQALDAMERILQG